MDGMILAAGLGTRLRPITDHTPKALVTVAGVPMLERIATRMIAAGVDRLIVNVHHHADQVRAFVDSRNGFGVDVRVSEESGAPLETGGGVLHARPHFRGDAPFLLHNVDVITDADLGALYRAHDPERALATLAVSERPSRRLLRFDEGGLMGRTDPATGEVEASRAQRGEGTDRAFAGVHVVSPAFFDLVEEEGAFSILAPYLRLAGAGHRIEAWELGDALWMEVGDPDRLERARRALSPPSGS